ncbi:MAG: RagB/SusD family nutrient uptake outer membrane protein, partial [Duncaniella sp.]|nr:RagB/SusD family nutrient uptake outer membrane protein [Duncaniella sp.]
MNKYIKYAFALALPTVALSSCDDYLDTMPDNRATLSDEEKIKSILVSAYPSTQCAFVTELSSDNVDDVELQSPDTDRWIDDAYAWKDELEESDESLNEYWASSYIAIASANQAIDAIDQLGGPDASITLSALRGEALLCRAYNHFMLANLFCKHWTQNAAEDLGLPYMTHPETELLPKYERGNLADFYIQIEKDLTEGLERVSDSYYSVPKYHFNQKAAYAFA